MCVHKIIFETFGHAPTPSFFLDLEGFGATFALVWGIFVPTWGIPALSWAILTPRWGSSWLQNCMFVEFAKRDILNYGILTELENVD